jgi:hypothetical protein
MAIPASSHPLLKARLRKSAPFSTWSVSGSPAMGHGVSPVDGQVRQPGAGAGRRSGNRRSSAGRPATSDRRRSPSRSCPIGTFRSYDLSLIHVGNRHLSTPCRFVRGICRGDVANDLSESADLRNQFTDLATGGSRPWARDRSPRAHAKC